MKPVFQTKFAKDGETGDCLRACVASILEFQTEEVPHFVEIHGHNWFLQLVNWSDKNGIQVLRVVSDFERTGDNWSLDFKTIIWAEDIPCIAIGTGPRLDKDGNYIGHAVVWMNGKIVHDPHPSGAGLIGNPDSLIFLMKNPITVK